MERNHTGDNFLTNTAEVKRVFDPIKTRWKNLWKNEEAKFRISTSLKMTSVPVFASFVMAGCIYILLKMNMIFFKANEFRGIDRFEEIFVEYLGNTILDLLPYGALLLIFVNITAIYISDIILRPFRTIGAYCEKKNMGEAASYNPDFFTDLKLLSQFSEFFFNTMETAEVNSALQKVVMPNKYTRIHQPVFETTFFMHYSLYLLATVLAVSIAFYSFAHHLYEGIINLANQTLPANPKINVFLSEQGALFDNIIIIVLVVTVLMYFAMARHLYQMIAAPAFAIFSTMRSFLKGNYSQRVHLIGYPFLRNQTRSLNKYLDWAKKNLVENSETKS